MQSIHTEPEATEFPDNLQSASSGMPLELNLEGLSSRITVNAAELEAVHLPVLGELAGQWRKRRGRFIVFLSGPPGSGKTTLAGIWEQLSRQGRVDVPVQALPMDGFHYANRVLESTLITIDGAQMPLRRIKGRPETFDLLSIRRTLYSLKAGNEVLWPRYDRTLHDPIPDAIPVLAEGIIIIEGLYMLLDAPGWKELRALADRGIFVECPADVARADLLARKLAQGRSSEDAAAHYALVDHYTWQLTMRQRHGIDSLIRIGPDRHPAIVPVTHE